MCAFPRPCRNGATESVTADQSKRAIDLINWWGGGLLGPRGTARRPDVCSSVVEEVLSNVHQLEGSKDRIRDGPRGVAAELARVCCVRA